MAKTLNLKESIAFLKKIGYNHIENNGKHFLAFKRVPDSDDEETERKIIQLARDRNRDGMNKAIKKDDRLNRKKEKQAIREGKADELPQNKPLYRADPWDHD